MLLNIIVLVPSDVTYLFINQEINEKEKKRKRRIKSRKIDKIKIKLK